MDILIADDEAIIRLGLKAMLEEMGHRVVGMAADGSRAIALARELAPDLVILDIKMPHQDGLEAAEAIAAERVVPIVLLTAYSDRDLVAQAASLPVHAYLVKPVGQPDLAAALEIAVSRFEEWQALSREAEGLREAMATRDVVERAKSVLMEREKLTEKAAFLRLQSRARRERRNMREVAEEILRAQGS